MTSTDSDLTPIDLSDGTGSPPLSSSQLASSAPWWRKPEQLVAIAAAVFLRWKGLLSEEFTALVLATVVGSPATKAILALIARFRGKK